jgi:hypothetical protein
MDQYAISDLTNWPADIQQIVKASDRKTFFNFPDWYQLVAGSGSRSESTAILAAERNLRIAMACLHEASTHTLRSCTNLYSCEFDLLTQGDNPESMAVFARELVGLIEPLDRIQFEGFDPLSPHFRPFVEGLRKAGLAVNTYFGWGNWFESVVGVDFERYISTRPSMLRNTWERKRRTLDRDNRANFQFHAAGEDPSRLVRIYEAVRKQSWKSAEPFPEFIPSMVQLAAKLDVLRMGTLFIDGIPAAAQFWIVSHGRATIFKLVHAEKCSELSPGTILTMEMMKKVLAEDHPIEIDFGRGDDAYKKLWLASRRERWGIEAANPRNLRGLWHAARIGFSLARGSMRRPRSV